MSPRGPLVASVLSTVFAIAWDVGLQAQDKKDPPAKAKTSAKRKTPDEVRADVEQTLPDGEGKDIFVFITNEKTIDPLGSGVATPRTSRMVHSIRGRKEAVDFIVRALTEGRSDPGIKRGPKGENQSVSDPVRWISTSWKFTDAFPATEKGEKDAAKAVERAKKNIAEYEKIEAGKRDGRKKFIEDAIRKGANEKRP